ncbi:MAG: peptidase M64 [Planctomycetes bacterium]|nr:peptidase M64 [Planctomycetota bacterium]
MHLTTLLIALSLAGDSGSSGDFDARFTGRTLRVDYYHSGTAEEAHISLDQVRLEGEWPGSRTRLLDDTNLGKYLLVVIDAATNVPLYTRGFCSIYGEWETIREAREGVWRSFHESQRFPEPRGRCQILLKKRASDGSFREIFSTTVDPSSRFVNRSDLDAPGKVWSLFEHGPAAEKLDLLILGDGYTAAELDRFREDARRLTEATFQVEPFRSRRSDFNVRAVDIVSARSGVADPRAGKWSSSPLGLSSNAFDIDRYVLTFENKALREYAALAPYDALALIANTRKYGGGGIFNLWLTCSASSGRSEHVFIHELGHSLAGLADEYYASRVAYEDFTQPGVEPWEPNVTALLEPDRLKWRNLVEPETPLPTPWDQKIYDEAALEYQARREALREANASDAEMEQLVAESRKMLDPIIAKQKYAGRVGAYEGAGYQARGLYRPELDCIMFSSGRGEFCAVCRHAIERVIDLYIR